MRTLLLVRHAKARKADRRLSTAIDRARPLSSRGRKDARRMGKRLARRSVHPDLIWVSPAQRTRQTARILAKKLDYPRKRIRVDPRLYATTAARLRQMVRGLNRKRLVVLLCGHNPELYGLARQLGAKLERLPTCAVVELSFVVERWSEVGPVTLAQATLELAQPKPTQPAHRASSR